ncbi:hypothetical protein DMC30DRAFT_426378 [Rhodotorula diobovata]|uniref:Transmembrane protein 188 n=1 Tax=Rhodotorula diobovata TaxID=5288 RepID=A0A5C5FNX7_9BASI|nr:hypothetical protein DMC30DRAFT_426378 [Rhodotorula diobovata]
MRRARTFHPPATRDSFKDLLIFEERLKQNAERQKQRRKYEAFLFTLVAVIAYLAYVVFVLPSIYSLVHYGNVALLLVAVTTLVLFFATGMYSEKIAYAHKRVPRLVTLFVPQANRALRPFNIYLNTRHRSRFSLSRLFGSPPPQPTSAALSRTSSGQSMASHGPTPPLSRRTSASSVASSSGASLRSAGAWRSPPVSPPLSPSSSPPSSPPPSSSLPLPNPNDPVTRALPPPPSSTSSSSTRGIPLPPIPPAQNPRGELIFSSRVSAQFREGYERYRGEWERRRAEAKRVQRERAKAGQGWRSWVRRAWGVGDPVQVRAGAGAGAGAAAAGEKSGDKGAEGGEVPRRAPVAALLDPREPRTRESSARSVASSSSSSVTDGDGVRDRGSSPPSRSSSPAFSEHEHNHAHDLEPTVPSSTSTPTSSRSASPARRSLSPLTSSASASPPRDDLPLSPARVRAESFSDLLTFDARSESGALRPPGLERSNSMRGGG